MPNFQQEWEKIVENFNAKWQFPNCIGAVDGKHVTLKALANSGSMYFNTPFPWSMRIQQKMRVAGQPLKRVQSFALIQTSG